MATRKSDEQKQQEAALRQQQESVEEMREAAVEADPGPVPPSGGQEVGPQIFETTRKR